eukprot:11204163-Lingulodinium_polyedra.AAC.1
MLALAPFRQLASNCWAPTLQDASLTLLIWPDCARGRHCHCDAAAVAVDLGGAWTTHEPGALARVA